MAPPVAIDTLPSIRDAKHVPSSSPALIPRNHFDPAKDLAYTPPTSTLSMKDIAYEPTQISPIAATEPFPFISREAILQMRREIFSPDVLDNCMHHTRPGSVQIRGMAPRYAPFIHSFWNSPEVLQIISDNAGVDLVPVMDYETSHTNVQLGPGGLDAVRQTPIEPPVATPEAIAEFERNKPKKREVTDQTKPIIEWHRDSHPFVCVVMLSDAQFMDGGETELQCGDGTTHKVKAPGMVSVQTPSQLSPLPSLSQTVSSSTIASQLTLPFSQGAAAILQGRYITHTAAPAANMPERITIVTSFRPRNPTLPDETTNMNIRNKSHLSELYYQWTTYRLKVMEERMRKAREALEKRYEEECGLDELSGGKKGLCRRETVDVKEVEGWVKEQVEYMEKTLWEMRPLENGR